MYPVLTKKCVVFQLNDDNPGREIAQVSYRQISLTALEAVTIWAIQGTIWAIQWDRPSRMSMGYLFFGDEKKIKTWTFCPNFCPVFLSSSYRETPKNLLSKIKGGKSRLVGGWVWDSAKHGGRARRFCFCFWRPLVPRQGQAKCQARADSAERSKSSPPSALSPGVFSFTSQYMHIPGPVLLGDWPEIRLN
jgi:hypothetical protein